VRRATRSAGMTTAAAMMMSSIWFLPAASPAQVPNAATAHPKASPPHQANDAVPRELVTALLGPRVRLIVGGTTDVLPASIYRNARVVGATVLEPRTTTVVAYPHLERSAYDTLHARLFAAGWSTPTDTAERVTARGRFRPAPLLFCREGASISFYSSRNDSLTYMSIVHTSAGAQSECRFGVRQ
jgi:hypothetical protein